MTATATKIQATRNYSTKRLARELGISRPVLRDTLTDNRVELEWVAERRTWVIVHKADVLLVIDFYANLEA